MKVPVNNILTTVKALRLMQTTLALFLIGLSGATLAANVPATLGYQGRLYDASGTPIASTLSVVFSIYPDATTTTAVWTETQSVTFTNGYFAVQLGSVNAINASAFDGTVRYLGVKVGTDAEMTPRSAISSVPYALAAPPDSRFGTNTSLATQGTGSGAQCTLGQVILTAGTQGTPSAIPATGQVLHITSNVALFSVLGTTYGGDGTSTFALPDLRGAAPNGLTYSICVAGVFP